eukprot:2351108-Rhodomonas_salina.1
MDEGSISGRASAFFLLQCVVFLALPLLPALQTEHQILAHDVCVRQLKRAPCVAALWVARLPFSLLLALVASLLVTLWTSIGFASFHFVLLGTWLSILAAEGLVARSVSLNALAGFDLVLGTDLELGFLFVCMSYGMPGTDMAYAGLYPYSHPMQSPVLTSPMVAWVYSGTDISYGCLCPYASPTQSPVLTSGLGVYLLCISYAIP